jgi:hypothetical protein
LQTLREAVQERRKLAIHCTDLDEHASERILRPLGRHARTLADLKRLVDVEASQAAPVSAAR